MPRLIATHVTKEMSIQFAQRLLPYNFTIGVNRGMNFTIKTMQLSMEKCITKPQEEGQLPTRAAYFAGIKNMFNSVSKEALVESIRVSFPELLPLGHLLYGAPVSVHHRWEDGSWRITEMLEGVNQGCPLSALFAALVLIREPNPVINRVLRINWAPMGHSGPQRPVIWSVSTYLLLSGESKSCRYSPGFHV